MTIPANSKPIRFFPIADTASGWYPDRALQEFKQASSLKLVTSPHQADLIWIFSYYLSLNPILSWPHLRHLLNQPPLRHKSLTHTPVITTIHHLSPQKKNIWHPIITNLEHITDYWHTANPTGHATISSISSKPIIDLPYWIDTNLFQPFTSSQKQANRQKLNIPKDHLIIGSFQRDTEADGQTPKLDKGPDIFCDIIAKIPQPVFVVLTGTRRQYVEKRLKSDNIPYLNVGHVPYHDLPRLYSILDYYLVTARLEGGPQSILETMATNTPILSTSVGISGLLHSSAIFSPESFTPDILRAANSPQVLAQHLTTATQYSIQNIIPQYDQALAQICTN